MSDDEIVYEALLEARHVIGAALSAVPSRRALDHARAMCNEALNVMEREALHTESGAAVHGNAGLPPAVTQPPVSHDARSRSHPRG